MTGKLFYEVRFIFNSIICQYWLYPLGKRIKVYPKWQLLFDGENENSNTFTCWLFTSGWSNHRPIRKRHECCFTPLLFQSSVINHQNMDVDSPCFLLKAQLPTMKTWQLLYLAFISNLSYPKSKYRCWFSMLPFQISVVPHKDTNNWFSRFPFKAQSPSIKTWKLFLSTYLSQFSRPLYKHEYCFSFLPIQKPVTLHEVMYVTYTCFPFKAQSPSIKTWTLLLFHFLSSLSLPP